MKQDTKQEYSLEKSIKILAEMTKKDIQRLHNFVKISPPRKVQSSYQLLGEPSVQPSVP